MLRNLLEFKGLSRGILLKPVLVILLMVITISLSKVNAQTYCTAYATSSADTRLDRVILNTIDNNTQANGCQTYTDHTSISTTLKAGTQYAFTVKYGTCGGQYTVYGKAWIDYNHDDDWDDPGEEIVTFPTGSNSNSHTEYFTVPASLTYTGATRMRVTIREGGAPTPCGTYTWGETEDYTVVLEAGASVSSVSSWRADGSYKAGDTISVYVKFSDNVYVNGTPQLTLETGTTDQTLNYQSGSGTKYLNFLYTVQAGDESSDLDYTSTSALSLHGSTIRDADSNDAILTLASPGATNSLGANKAIIIDTETPTVSSISSSTTDGTYKVGDVIAVTATFSEAVTVTGTPQIELETGTTDRTIDYSSGSGTSTLTFNYTVQAGDESSDLDYTSTSALSLNSGTISDAAGNNATLTLASPGAANSLGANKALVVDGIVPTVSSVSSTTANGSYKAGDVIAVTVTFSEAVTVTGTPQIELETGTTDRTVNYSSGSGTTTLTFNYTVQSGDESSDLDYTGTSALTLNGGTIKDAAGNSATLTLASPGAANSLGNNKALVIDAIVPTVSNVSSSSSDGTYGVGGTVLVTVNFSEAVTVTGTPQIELETGTTDRTVNYTSGSGTSTLTFSYTVQSGDQSSDLDYTGTSALTLNGGTIKDAAGNSATLTLASPGAANSLGANKAIVINGLAPSVTGVSSTTANGSYNAGDVIAVTITFSSSVTVTGTPQLELETGTTDRTIDYSSGSGTTTLTFNYTVQAGDASSDLDYTSANALTLNGGTIKDGSSNDATLTLPTPGTTNSLGANKAIIIDTESPTVSSVSSSTANGSYNAGDVIAVTVTFSEAVTVTGTPQIELETGTTDRTVDYSSGSGTSTLTFNYTVQSGDETSDLDYTSTSALSLNSGTISDAAGNNATLTLASPGATNSLGANKALVIDTESPIVNNVSSTTSDGSYKLGDVIAVTVTFSEAVTVTGTPQIELETGTTDRTVDYSSGSGTSTLTFNYTVQSGDETSDLDYTGTSALSLNSGSISDAAGNNATLTLASPGATNSLGDNKALVVDGVTPSVSSVSSTTANGTYKTGDVIAVTVTFSEAVTVTGTPQIELETGTTDRTVDYSSGSGTSTLTFNYTVQSGDETSDLDYTGTSALTLNGGTIKDAVGNSATLTLASPGATNSLGDNKALVIDGIVPTITNVTSTKTNGTYIIGDVIAVTVSFSEAVTVTGTPQIELETGTTDRTVDYSSGSGTSTLTFNYTVQSGDVSSDLDYTGTGALTLNGGTIKDAAGNSATLTLTSPGAANSLGNNKALVIDGIAPTVTNVSSTTANGTYDVTEVIAVTVSFSDNVTVTGTPQIELETGAVNRKADYNSGSGTSTLTFNYTVQSGDGSSDLDYTSTSALTLNGGTIKDASGNNADLSLATPGATNSLSDNKDIVIITTMPEIAVKGNLTEIVDNDITPTATDSTNFGNVDVSSDSKVVIFWIVNEGDDTLFLTGSPKVAISGTHAVDFTVQSQPSGSYILPSDSLSFEVKFDPSAAGTRSAEITITNDDDDEGTYNFNIEGFGCDLVAQITVDSNVSCNGYADGGLTASQTGGTAIYSYSWSNSASTATITGLLAGTYTVTITDQNGCESSDNETITEPAVLAATSSSTDVSCYGGSDGALQVSISGGTSPYNSLWSDNSTAEDLTSASAGIYSSTITDANECSIIITDTINEPNQVDGGAITYSYPVSTPTSICYNTAPGTIGNQTSASGGSTTLVYTWEYSTDGTNYSTASGTNNGATYTPGNLTQKTWFRRAATDNACSQTDYSNVVSINVYDELQAGSISGTTSICQYNTPNKITETVSASGAGASYSYVWQYTTSGTSWTTISGATSTEYQPGSLTETTWYRRIDISDNCSEQDTTNEVKITVNPKPVANFSATTECLDDQTDFTNSSTIASGSITTYAWDFDDTKTSSLSSPSHYYGVHGNYDVELIITSDQNCKDTVSKSVEVYAKPSANFSFNNECYGDTASMTNSTSIAAGSIASYAWSFGDGNTSASSNPQNYYASDGSYTIQLIATSDNSCKDTLQKSITIYPKPASSFSASNACLENGLTFSNASTVSSGSITSYYYDFGDSESSTSENPHHYYANAGSYTVNQYIETALGCKDTSDIQVTVYHKPVAEFSYTPGCVGEIVYFTDNTTIGSGSISSYRWDMDDLSGYHTQQNPLHVYSSTGTYDVEFIVTSNNNCKDTIVKQVTVTPVPVASFAASNVCFGDSMSFVNSSSIASGTMSYVWSFGDGDSAYVEDPVHLYTATGSYTVTLKVISDNNCEDVVSRIVKVYELPNVSFTASNECYGQDVSFTNKSTLLSGTLSYAWNFGDAGSSTTENPSHSYGSSGSYSVKLIAESNLGCKDSTSNTITVYPKSTADFSVTNDCVSEALAFSNQSTVSSGSLSYSWDFGDASSSTISNPTHKYSTSGSYTVTLYTTTDKNCKDTFSSTVTAYPLPSPSFTVSDVCDGYNISLSNNSSISSGSIASQSWSLGDGNTSALSAPTHTYSTYGTYTIKLVATSDMSCMDSTTNTVTVHPMPVVSFTAGNVCNGESVAFNNGSTVATGSNSYGWSFGDNKTSNNTSPDHTYASAGTYSVKLVATTDKSCTDSLTKSVTIYPMPNPSFAVADVCDGENISITNTSSISSGTLSNAWSFGDGNTSTSVSPTHTYGSDGTYTIKLVTTSDMSCVDSTTKSVTINPMPVVSFTANNVCDGSQVLFTNTSSVSSGSNSYSWDFADGNTSSLTNPGNTYASSGTYAVKLIATTNKSCIDSVTNNVTVHPMPVAGFSAGNVCFGESTSFTNTSTISSGSLSYVWNFGDGDSSILANPSHVYASPGTYTVYLTVTSNNGCETQISKVVKVYELPSVSFTASNECYGQDVSFTNKSTLTNGTLSYAWDFDDAGSSTTENPSHSYGSSGSYSVKLIAESNLGCKDSTSNTITVYPKSTADFSVTNDCVSKALAFSNQSTVSSGSLSYSWDFGDASSSTISNPTHKYTSSGSYTVTLYTTTDKNCKDTFSSTVTAYPLPSPSFTVNDVCDGYNISLSNNSGISSGSIASQSWSLGDGNTSALSAPTHTYSTYGTYTIKLVATSDMSCMDSTTNTVTVHPMPAVSFTAGNVCNGESVAFNNGSTVATGSNSYGWSFGDNKTSNNTSPDHTYAGAGTYSVKLVATTDKSCTDSLTKSVTIYPMPNPSFAVADVCDGENISITNTSSISSGTLSNAWSFGDGNTSTSVSPTHTYGSDGSYTIKLVTTSDMSCVDSTTKSVTINPMPLVSFTANNVCDGSQVSFTNTSSVSSGSNSYSWDFADGNTSSLTNPGNTYASSGTYAVKLIATTNKSCIDSVTNNVTVHPMPVAGFSAGNVCFGESTSFTNTSTISSGSLSYVWNFGDGDSSILANPSHAYASPGTYTVYLTVTSNNGCETQISKVVKVYELPNVSFTASNECYGQDVSFTNKSTLLSGTLSYAWNFGDASSSTTANPTHYYNGAGSYSVKLIAESNLGCKDSTSNTITIYPKPMAGFSVTNDCVSENLSFVNSSTVSSGTNSYVWDFGDSTSSTSKNPDHKFASHGNYNVTLYTTTDKNCRDTISKSVTVYPLPTPGFAVQNVCDGSNISISNASSIANGSITAYNWSLGDGNASALSAPTHTYSTYGTYTIKLVATSDMSCVDSISKDVTIYPMPNVSFTANNVCDDESVEFKNTSNVGTGSNSYQWNYGDGNTSTNPSPSYTYAGPGTYSVKLIATTDKLCVDSISKNVTVHPMPVPVFSVQDVCDGTNITLTNTSNITSGSITNSWSLGDGNTSALSAPTHTYGNYGTYTIKLVTTSDMSCKDSVSHNVTIHPMPNVSFTANNVCDGEGVSFKNKSSVGAGSNAYEWNYGDGNTSNNTSPVYTYAGAGTYSVKLIATTDKLCVDSVSQNVTIHPMPVPGFSVQDVCDGTNITLNNTSNITSGSLTNSWSLGDGNTSTLSAPTHTYSSYGTYTIKLVTTSDMSCKDSVSHNVTIHPMPSVAFTVNDICYGENALFTNGSGVVTGSNSYAWDFGDGNTSTNMNPMHFYNNSGSYSVKLVATTDKSCSDSLTKTVGVHSLPLATLTVEDMSCYGLDNGRIEVNVTQGKSPYKYSLDGKSYKKGNDFSGLTKGSYTVYILDDYNCADTTMATVNEPAELKMNIDKTNVACYQDGSGAIEVLANGGITPYSYSIDGTNYQANKLFSKLSGGSYLVSVRDSNQCAVSQGVTLYEPSSPLQVQASSVVDVLCKGESSGAINVTGNGGTGQILFSIDQGQSYQAGGSFNKLVSNQYKILAMDVNGCMDSVYVDVDEPAKALTIDMVDVSDVLCYGENTGAFTLHVSGGTQAYTYKVGNGSLQSDSVFDMLSEGSYTVYVVDANLCETSQNVNVDEPTSALEAQIVNIQNIQCPDDNDGSIEVQGIGGTPSYEYSLDDVNYQSTGLFQNLSFGDYTLYVKDNNACTFTYSANITSTTSRPVADFTEVVNFGSVAFTNKSQFATSYLWDFGDGNTSTDVSPVHTYASKGSYNIVLVASNICTSDTISSIQKDGTPMIIKETDVKELEASFIKVYPNPVDDKLMIDLSAIEGNNDDMTIRILDVSGKVIMTETYAHDQFYNQVQLDVSGYARGIYFLDITIDSFTSKYRIIKK